MINVDNVTQWFRDAPSHNRLQVLCRLLECCVPHELQYLATFLEELLRRNMVLNAPSDATYANLKHLGEITDSNCRRQLCLLLTRLKSANKIPAYNIYDILIRYDFAKFFSRVISMEEELVDEILLLFTLAANHPAMTFSQRNRLSQRLVELRETIDQSFKCCQIDVNCVHDTSEEYICGSLESEDTTSKDGEESASAVLLATQPDDTATLNIPTKVEAKKSKEIVEVHIKDLRIVKVQQRSYDKKYEYVFEVTWSNGKVIKIHRPYGELFDFQCKLRRRHSKDEIKVTGRRRVIPYLPPRRPIKFCKGNDILPDISDYVREFAQLPDKLLHSEWVENFFSDGNERDLDEPNIKTSKSKHNSGQDKKESVVSKQTELPHVNGVVKPDKENGLLRKHSPRGKPQISVSCKKSTICHQTSGRLESKKRNIASSKSIHIDTTTSNKDGNEVKTINHPPEVNCNKSPSSRSSHLNTSAENRILADSQENKENAAVTNENQVATKTLVSMTTSSPPKNSEIVNGHADDTNSETIIKDEKVVDKIPTITPRTPLTVAVSVDSPVCFMCSTFNQSSSEGSLTSSMSPLGSPVTSFALGPSRSPSVSSSPEQHHFDFALVTCPTEESNTVKLLKLCHHQKYENLFKDYTDEQVLSLRDSDIDKMDMTQTDKQTLKSSINRLKSSFQPFPRNGYNLSENNARHNPFQHGLLIVPNGVTHYPLDQRLLTETEHFTTSSMNETCHETLNGWSSKTKMADKNCNYISQNGEHNPNVDVNSNTTYACKKKIHLNEQSNGFHNPYCFNCGGCGHAGHHCLETSMEGPSVS